MTGQYSSGREWAMSLDVACRVDTCPTTDGVTVRDVSAHGATEGAKKVLRYRGWLIDRRDNLCPEHAGPIPVCEVCGEATPITYAVRNGKHITGKAHTCLACYRAAMDARIREDQAARIAKEYQS